MLIKMLKLLLQYNKFSRVGKYLKNYFITIKKP